MSRQGPRELTQLLWPSNTVAWTAHSSEHN